MKAPFLRMALVAPVLSAGAPLASYTYVAPEAKALLAQAGLDEKGLVALVDAGLRRRGLVRLEDGRLFEGSEDTLRVDLRRKGKRIVLALAVQQGVSVHFMLTRWQGEQPLKAATELRPALERLLDDLKAATPSDAYRKGQMPEE